MLDGGGAADGYSDAVDPPNQLRLETGGDRHGGDHPSPKEMEWTLKM